MNNLQDWLESARPNVVFEATSLDVETGQPAIDHIRAALEFGAHAVTANKGPIVHAYRELRDLAVQRGKNFLFESTVMDGVPIFSMFRTSLPAIEVKSFKGILNSTTNVILTGMEQGLSFEDALRKAQSMGIAETDASYDIDGWDAAVKVAALVNVVLDFPLHPKEVEREGIRALSGDQVRSASQSGKALQANLQRHARGIKGSRQRKTRTGPARRPVRSSNRQFLDHPVRDRHLPGAHDHRNRSRPLRHRLRYVVRLYSRRDRLTGWYENQ